MRGVGRISVDPNAATPVESGVRVHGVPFCGMEWNHVATARTLIPTASDTIPMRILLQHVPTLSRRHGRNRGQTPRNPVECDAFVLHAVTMPCASPVVKTIGHAFTKNIVCGPMPFPCGFDHTCSPSGCGQAEPRPARPRACRAATGRHPPPRAPAARPTRYTRPRPPHPPAPHDHTRVPVRPPSKFVALFLMFRIFGLSFGFVGGVFWWCLWVCSGIVCGWRLNLI